jgi:hypothetical protein
MKMENCEHEYDLKDDVLFCKKCAKYTIVEKIQKKIKKEKKESDNYATTAKDAKVTKPSCQKLLANIDDEEYSSYTGVGPFEHIELDLGATRKVNYFKAKFYEKDKRLHSFHCWGKNKYDDEWIEIFSESKKIVSNTDTWKKPFTHLNEPIEIRYVRFEGQDNKNPNWLHLCCVQIKFVEKTE